MASNKTLSARSPELQPSFLRRVEECRGTKRSNCIGTALFIAGVASKDRFVECSQANSQFLKHLRQSELPVPGALVAWVRVSKVHRVFVLHMGVVSSVQQPNKILITHRSGREGIIIEDEATDDSGTMCGFARQLSINNPASFMERYYLPPVLQQYWKIQENVVKWAQA
jgi:hypothetical protein